MQNVYIKKPHCKQEKEFYILYEDFISAWQVNDGLTVTFKQ